MWTRRELKTRAKAVLKNIYWKAFLISIVIALASGKYSGGGGENHGGNAGRYLPAEMLDATTILNFVIICVLVIAGFLFFTLLRILIGYPLEVGGRRYFVLSAEYADNTKCFRYAFEGGNYLSIVKTMLYRGVLNFLWFLLLIVPGIIKLYAYRMVPYILADNPNIGARKAVKLSMAMTRGHKFDIFVLDLSFIGWFLLGVLALFIGTLFVLPYYNAANAELYLVLRNNALENGMCEYEDLLLNYPV